MIAETLHIKNPSKRLLELIRGLRQQKEANRKKFESMEHVYFPITEEDNNFVL